MSILPSAPAARPDLSGAPGVVRFYNFLPPGNTFLDDVLAGLSLPQRAIPPKYFYDEAGSRLFEQICGLEEYYPTRTEMGILRAAIEDIAHFAGSDLQLIEFGSGAGIKTRILLERLRPSLYVPIDIDGGTLRDASLALAERYPWLNVSGILADMAQPLELPQFIGAPIRRKLAFFPGSTVGNFTRDEAIAFLKRVRAMVGKGGLLLIGVDLKKDRAVLEAAYDDAQGVTAAFNLNLLTRINRELGADFQPRRFSHVARYDEALGRVEMYLKSDYQQFVKVAGRRFDFKPGETIHTEISCKYGVEEFRELAAKAGFFGEKVWVDSGNLFSVHGMTAR